MLAEFERTEDQDTILQRYNGDAWVLAWHNFTFASG